MPRTIQCNQCGIILNLPENSSGKRLKMPQVPLKVRRRPRLLAVSHDGEERSRRPGGLLVPAADWWRPRRPAPADRLGDLRETFDLPLLTGADAARDHDQEAASAAKPADTAADALLLFEERKPAPAGSRRRRRERRPDAVRLAAAWSLLGCRSARPAALISSRGRVSNSTMTCSLGAVAGVGASAPGHDHRAGVAPRERDPGPLRHRLVVQGGRWLPVLHPGLSLRLLCRGAFAPGADGEVR